MPKEYVIAKTAIASAKQVGLFGAVEKVLKNAASHSAPFTHPNGNRRFNNLILEIEGDRVVNVCKYDPQTEYTYTEVPPNTQGQGVVMVTCPDCNADGGVCLTCNSTGMVSGARRHDHGKNGLQ